jgi:hypothetical protein
VILVAAPPPTLPGDPLGTVVQDPDQVRQRACHIVSSNPLTCSTTSPKAPSPPTTSHLSWLSWLIWLVLLAAVVLAAVTVIRAIATRPRAPRVRRRRRDRTEPDDEIEVGAVAIDRTREPFDWRAEADAHRRAGRHRNAVRCRYRALVGDLARLGLIDEVPGRTTGEERGQLRTVLPAASSPFDAAADLFDDAWYGHAVVDAADDDRFQSLEADVLVATARGAVHAGTPETVAR